MPLLLLVPLAGVALWVGSAINNAGQTTANTLTGTNTPPAASSFPSWVIPSVLVGIGALLLYKEGAKLLKL